MFLNRVFKFVIVFMFVMSVFTVITVIVITITNHQSKTPSFGDRFDKLSIDDTPLVIITDKTTHCRYVFNTVSKTLSDYTGSNQCSNP